MAAEKTFEVQGITACDYATAVFTNLFLLLEKKGVLSMREVGEALIADADEPESTVERNEGAVLYIRELGRALVRGSHTLAEPGA